MPNRRQSEPTRANYSPRESNAKNLSKKAQEQKALTPTSKIVKPTDVDLLWTQNSLRLLKNKLLVF